MHFLCSQLGLIAGKLLGSEGKGMRSTVEILTPLRDSTAAVSRRRLENGRGEIRQESALIHV